QYSSCGPENRGSACGGRRRADRFVSWCRLRCKKPYIRSLCVPPCQGSSALELLWISRVRAEYNGADGPHTVPALFSSLAPEQLIHVDPRILAELSRVVSA